MFNFLVSTPLLQCWLSIPPAPNTHPPKKPEAHSPIFVTGGAGLWLSTRPYSLPRVTFMASSAMRVRWQSFQARIYLPGCISMHCGIFLHGKEECKVGEGRIQLFWWKVSCSSAGSLSLPQQYEHFQDSWATTAGTGIYSLPRWRKTIVLRPSSPCLRAVPCQARLQRGNGLQTAARKKLVGPVWLLKHSAGRWNITSQTQESYFQGRHSTESPRPCLCAFSSSSFIMLRFMTSTNQGQSAFDIT